MKFTQLPPPDILKNVVRYFWTLENSDDSVITGNRNQDSNSGSPAVTVPNTNRVFRITADGCPGIVFQHSDQGRFHKDNNKLPEIFLYGQSTRYAELSLEGKFNTIGLSFYPDALKLLFELNAEELTDTCMDLDPIAAQQGFRLTGQLSATGPLEDQIQFLSGYLYSRLRAGEDNRITDSPMQYALSRILHSKGSLSLKALQDTLQVTERSFERKFKQWVGISPKLFSRICRFQASLAQLRDNDYSKLSDIAYDNDYADQSHLIRSFKEFAGISPFQFQKQYNELVENFSERRP